MPVVSYARCVLLVSELSLPVISLVGVVLIARPVALFGNVSQASHRRAELSVPDTADKGTPEERLVAVGFDTHLSAHLMPS